MKNKITIALIVLIVVLMGVGYYFKQSGALGGSRNNVPTNAEENKLVTDDFEINLPQGWIKTEPTMGASAMAVKENEEFDNPAVNDINFKSYLAVSHEVVPGKSLADYMTAVKNGLAQLVPEVSFGEEKDVTINGREARAMELEMAQQGVKFKVLIVAIKGDNDDVWTISFNTTEDSWDKYKETFSNVSNSFNLKK
jgi:hypothetical protein